MELVFIRPCVRKSSYEFATSFLPQRTESDWSLMENHRLQSGFRIFLLA